MSRLFVYRITWAAHRGPCVRTFTSVQAFDGYIGQLRKAGSLVSFIDPFTAQAAL